MQEIYERYWGLQRPLFGPAGQRTAWFDGPYQQEALSRMQYLQQQRRRLGLLLGSSGVGKSSVLAQFAARMQRMGHRVACMGLVAVGVDEFLTQLVLRLGGNIAAGAGLSASWRILTDQLAAIGYQQTTAVVLLDDAEQASAELIPVLRRLVKLDEFQENCLCMILAVNPAGLRQLDRQLCEQVHLRIDLRPWDRWQTARFVAWSLERAGADRPLFAAEALQRLYQCSGGAPRRVIQLAELCLIAAAGNGLELVDGPTVLAVSEQLAWSPELAPAVLQAVG